MKKITTKLTLLGAALFSVTLMAQSQTDRLVVSSEVASGASTKSATTAKATPKNEYCFTLNSGDAWCVPVLNAGQDRVKSKSAAGEKVSLRTAVVRVPAELSIEQAERMLKNTGMYTYVERDVAIKGEATWNATLPNDPRFDIQTYFKDNSAENPTASSISTLWGKLQNSEMNTDIYVLDSGFRLHQDLTYADGVNFTVVSFDNERRPGFLEDDFDPDRSCQTSHGLGVAGVIAAGINNEKNVAGIVGGATVHPIRVMDCNDGFLSDVAYALGWLAGRTDVFAQSPDLPAFTGKPGVINMSLGGATAGCPAYIQNGIDAVVAKGFVVVVSAGNESMDASTQSPANCKNVITVGASTNAGDGVPADIADFSNYGDNVTVMAQGMSVASLTRDDNTAMWNGTSFSSPIVAGIIAAVEKDFDFTQQQWNMLVSISGENRWTENSRCETVGCGAGILNAATLYDNAKALSAGQLDTMSYLLNELAACNQSWFTSVLLKSNEPCSWVLVEVQSLGIVNEDQHIKLWSVEKGADNIAQNRTLRGNFATSKFTVNKDIVADRDFYVQKCDNSDDTCGNLSKLDTSELEDMPVACK